MQTQFANAFIGLETIDGDASVNLRSQLPFHLQLLASRRAEGQTCQPFIAFTSLIKNEVPPGQELCRMSCLPCTILRIFLVLDAFCVCESIADARKDLHVDRRSFQYTSEKPPSRIPGC